MSAVELSRLEKRFGSVPALRGVSAEIPSGTLTRITGPNGAGKSTLLRILAGLTRPTRGAVRTLGFDPFSRAGALQRGRVGFLGEAPGLYGDLTIRENLKFCAKLHGLSTERVDEILGEAGLEPVADRRLRNLSLGYRRRSGIARVLLTRPALLLLDEPWNGLDPDAAQSLLALLERHRERGQSALVVAHNLPGADTCFDSVLHLEDGRLRAPGPAQA